MEAVLGGRVEKWEATRVSLNVVRVQHGMGKSNRKQERHARVAWLVLPCRVQTRPKHGAREAESAWPAVILARSTSHRVSIPSTGSDPIGAQPSFPRPAIRHGLLLERRVGRKARAKPSA